MASAIVTVEEFSSPTSLRNHGYSNSMADMVQYTKASANSQDYIIQEEAKHLNDCKFVKFIRKVFTYADPSLDDGKFMNHDIKLSPSIDDL